MKGIEFWIWINQHYLKIIKYGLFIYFAMKLICTRPVAKVGENSRTVKMSLAGKTLSRIYYVSMVMFFVLYFTTLMYITLARHKSDEMQYELSFLWEYRLALKGDVVWIREIRDNILLFFPFGLFLGEFIAATKRFKPHWYVTLIVGTLLSLAIELTQLFGKLGLFEFDDIFNNAIGTLLGYMVFAIANGVLKLVKRAV